MAPEPALDNSLDIHPLQLKKKNSKIGKNARSPFKSRPLKENASKTIFGQLNTVPDAFRFTQKFIEVMRKFDLAYNQTSNKDNQR